MRVEIALDWPRFPTVAEMDGYRAAIDRLKADPGCHGRWLRLGTFHVPPEWGMGVAVRYRLKWHLGPAERMSGLRFQLIPDVDGAREHLAVRYRPDAVEPGALEDWRRKPKERFVR
jgi:hypothetical protein